MQASFVLIDRQSGGFDLRYGARGVLSPEGTPVTASLVLTFGGSDLTRGVDSISGGMSRTAVSLVLTCGGSDPACGAGGTSELGSSCTADFLVLIRVRLIRFPGDGVALPLSDGPMSPPSLAETASRVLIRGRSRGDGSWREGRSAGAFGGGRSAGISWGADRLSVCGSPSGSRPLPDFFFFSRDSTLHRA